MAVTALEKRLLIGGEWIETGEWLEIRSPYSGQVVGRIPKAGAAEAQRAEEVNGNGTAIMIDHLLRATEMEAEHLNAIASALAGLKDRTSQLRRYL